MVRVERQATNYRAEVLSRVMQEAGLGLDWLCVAVMEI